MIAWDLSVCVALGDDCRRGTRVSTIATWPRSRVDETVGSRGELKGNAEETVAVQRTLGSEGVTVSLH